MTRTRARKGALVLAVAAIFAVLPGMAIAADLDSQDSQVLALQATPTATAEGTAEATATPEGTAAATPDGTATGGAGEPGPAGTGNAGLIDEGAGGTTMLIMALAALGIVVGGALAVRATSRR